MQLNVCYLCACARVRVCVCVCVRVCLCVHVGRIPYWISFKILKTNETIQMESLNFYIISIVTMIPTLDLSASDLFIDLVNQVELCWSSNQQKFYATGLILFAVQHSSYDDYTFCDKHISKCYLKTWKKGSTLA